MLCCVVWNVDICSWMTHNANCRPVTHGQCLNARYLIVWLRSKYWTIDWWSVGQSQQQGYYGQHHQQPVIPDAPPPFRQQQHTVSSSSKRERRALSIVNPKTGAVVNPSFDSSSSHAGRQQTCKPECVDMEHVSSQQEVCTFVSFSTWRFKHCEFSRDIFKHPWHAFFLLEHLVALLRKTSWLNFHTMAMCHC